MRKEKGEVEMRGLDGRRVILTGGASGIGRATTLRLADEGCVVGVFDQNLAGADETVHLCAGKRGRVLAFQVDVTDRDAVAAAADKFEAAAGPVELLANVAGWDIPIPFLETDRAFWDKIIGINLYGPLNLHHVVVKRMAERGFGRVVNMASDAGRVGSSGESVYSACKGGLIALTKTLAREMARSNIKLNAVAPGPTDTALFHGFIGEGEAGAKVHAALEKSIPLRRIAKPEDIVGAVVFLASEEADYITGQVISVSGGLTMAG